jgi:hypothetical protein
MSDTKKGFLVSKVVVSDNAVWARWQEFHYTKQEAQNALASFAKRCEHLESPPEMVPWQDSVHGTCADGYHKDATYRGEFQKVRIKADELEDNEDDYEVEIKLIREYTTTVTVTAADEDRAQVIASERARDGYYDDEIELDYPDDQDVEVIDTTLA